MFLIFRKCN